MLKKQNRILKEVEFQLHMIGSANDAEDHQYMDSAYQMRSEASASLYSLVDQNPGLNIILPSLLTELDTGHIYGFGWSILLDQINEYRAAST
jgi:hypothetical protein